MSSSGLSSSIILTRRAAKKQILIVDDYLLSRNLLAEALDQTGNYDIVEAGSGYEALSLFGAGHYDMVISDIMMPGMSGMELLDSIRKINAATPVIMITAHPALELSVAAIKNGAVDFLKKPFDIDSLLFKVDLYLREDGRQRDGDIKAKKEELSLQSYIYDIMEKIDGESGEIFQKIVDLALIMVNGGSCALFLYDQEINEFHPKIVRNNGNNVSWQDLFVEMKDIFNKVVDEKDALMIHSEDDPRISPSMICAPLMIRNKVMGVLGIRKKKGSGIFTNNEFHHVLSLTKRASLNIENKVLYESIYSNLIDTFLALVASIQARDHYTEEHSYRVTELAVKIAAGCDCSDQEISSLRIAALLHDIGKISIPDNILLKNAALTVEEYGIIKNHPCIGDEILMPVILLDKERRVIRHHHERWDGKGYPQGLSADRIPLLARILAVADSFDAMTNDRPYRTGASKDLAIKELKKNIDMQFEGKIVDVFLNLL